MQFIAGRVIPDTWRELAATVIAIVILIGLAFMINNASEIAQIILGN